MAATRSLADTIATAFTPGRRIFEHIPGWARKFYRDQVFPRLPNSMQGRKFSYNVSLPWQERYVDGLSFLPAFERDIPLLSRRFSPDTEPQR